MSLIAILLLPHVHLLPNLHSVGKKMSDSIFLSFSDFGKKLCFRLKLLLTFCANHSGFVLVIYTRFGSSGDRGIQTHTVQAANEFE